MWWAELDRTAAELAAQTGPALGIDPAADIDPSARLDASAGPIGIGAGSRICAGATLVGPLRIGRDCLIGNLALVRGPAIIGDGCRIGFASEIKNARLDRDVSVGPQCFVADSWLEEEVYLGAQVRTSNQRLDRRPVEVIGADGQRLSSGRDKLGCRIGAGAALGIQTIVLPGRVVAPGTEIGPRVTVEKNLPPGRYRLAQTIEIY